MKPSLAQKVSISLSAELLDYAERYKTTHGLASRSDVIALALETLRQRELYQSYRQEAHDSEEHPDAWVDSGLSESLELMER